MDPTQKLTFAIDAFYIMYGYFAIYKYGEARFIKATANDEIERMRGFRQSSNKAHFYRIPSTPSLAH